MGWNTTMKNGFLGSEFEDPAHHSREGRSSSQQRRHGPWTSLLASAVREQRDAGAQFAFHFYFQSYDLLPWIHVATSMSSHLPKLRYAKVYPYPSGS